MNALILAAGLGTRLRPWTLSHPKALVPVGGQPMLGRVIDNLRTRGFDTLTVNIHHFGDQIIDYIYKEYPEAAIAISDERDLLRDTGGALRHAAPHLRRTDITDGVLVHNVDILSDAPLEELMRQHRQSGADLTLMVSARDSSRALLWDAASQLRGWKNLTTGETRLRTMVPVDHRGAHDATLTTLSSVDHRGAHDATLTPLSSVDHRGAHEVSTALPDSYAGHLRPLAFSGIYVVGPRALEAMEAQYPEDVPFSIIDFMLDKAPDLDIRAAVIDTPGLIDIGKPDTLHRANLSFTPEE